MHEKTSGINQGTMRGKGKVPNTETNKGETDDCEHRCKKLKPDVRKTAVRRLFLHSGATGADTQFKRVEPPSWISFYPIIFHLGLFCKHTLQVLINRQGITLKYVPYWN